MVAFHGSQPESMHLEREIGMTGSTSNVALLGLAVVFTALLLSSPARADARADIRALEDHFAAAVKAKDLDAIMQVYVPDQSLVVFDAVPPRQYIGAAAYRKDWQEFLALFQGPVTFQLSDLDIVADHTLAYSHSIQRVAGSDKAGQPLDLTVRVTDVYKKIKGRWLIIHEHVSVPVDLATGKPDLASKP